jgi:phospholipid/cholesterol/gamma-HCH transport system substrate-binding protein
MFQSRTVEIGVGLFVALGLAALFMLAMKVSNLAALSSGNGFEVLARFQNVGGLKVRAPVTMGGVRIGRVKAIDYDDQSYQAVVTLDIEERWSRIPADTTASIFTAGLLGEQYVGLEAGGEEDYLKPGSEMKLTQSALVLEQIIGQFLFSKASETPKAGNGGAGTQPAVAPAARSGGPDGSSAAP